MLILLGINLCLTIFTDFSNLDDSVKVSSENANVVCNSNSNLISRKNEDLENNKSSEFVIADDVLRNTNPITSNSNKEADNASNSSESNNL